MPLETARLILDVWQNSDWTAFRPIAEDPEVMRYITGGTAWSEEQIRRFVDRQVALYAERGFCRWRVLERAGGEFMGFCGVGFWGEGLEPEIGWWLARRYWGCGLATEAARCALRDAFERVGLERVVSVAMVGNAASRRVMEKLGLRMEREFENEGVRLVQYAISRGEFLLRRGESGVTHLTD
jgi:RimJ/RimL family protein N-acetyltransferase